MKIIVTLTKRKNEGIRTTALLRIALLAAVLMTLATASAVVTPFDSAPAAAATTYYVSPSGNNGNPGTEAQPFRTIQQAVGSAGPGDTIVVKPGIYGPAHAEGTYGHAEWNANRDDGRGGTSGTATARIVLKAEYPATEFPESQRSIIEGNGSSFGLFLNGFDYITIDGFEITNFAAGIGLQGQSNHLIIRRNILRSNTAAGMECAPCSDNLFEYNAFLDPGPPYPELDDAIQDYGLNFFQGSANNVVVHNYFFGKHNQALSWKRRAGPGYAAFNTFEGFMYTAVYLGQNDDEAEGGDMTSFDVTVEYNVFRDAVDEDTGAYYRGRSPITIRNLNNAIVRYNYIEHMWGAAIYVRGCEGGYYCATVAGKEPVGAKIYGNTIVNGRMPDSGSVVNPPDDPSGAIGAPVAFYISGRGYEDDHIEIYNNTIYHTDQALAISGTPDYITTRESPNPPRLTIKNNNFVNVGEGGVVFVEDTTSETTTFAHNNWYELDNSDINNGQGLTDTHLNPLFVGPLTVFPPQPGPNPVFDADFSRNQAYRLSETSPLIDAGVDVGLPFRGGAPDIGSNEFIPDPAEGPPLPPTPTPPALDNKPFPIGDAPPFGWTACWDMARCRDDGFTVIHRAYYGNISGAEADQWAQDAAALSITQNFINSTPFDLMRNNPLSEQYSVWKAWFQAAISTLGPGAILGYYLPDEPEPSGGEYDKVNEIMRAMKDVDPQALGILYDGGVDPGTLTAILGTTGPGIDVLLDGGYPVLHPEYGGHGWVYGRLQEIEGVVKAHGKTIWIVTEGFDTACAIPDAKERAKSHMALGILGGAQGVMTYAYIYSVDTACYTAHLEFLPLYRQLWPWIKAGNKTELPVTVTSGPAMSPVYNLSHEASYTSVAAWLFTDDHGQKMLGTANLLDNAAVEATVSGMPVGVWHVLGEGRWVTVDEDGTLMDSWAPLGYHFYTRAKPYTFYMPLILKTEEE